MSSHTQPTSRAPLFDPSPLPYYSRDSNDSDTDQDIVISSINREDSRTHLQGPDSSIHSADYHQPATMVYPPAPPEGPQSRHSFQTVPLKDDSGTYDPDTSGDQSSFGPRVNFGSSPQSTIMADKEKRYTESMASSRRQSTEPFRDAARYNPANAKDSNMRFADGDAGTNAFSRVWLWLADRGIIVRWILFIIPLVALLWIPGIVDFVRTDRRADPPVLTQVWGVDLRWWSIWLTIVWVTLWGCKAIFMIFPKIFDQTIAIVVPNMKQYTPVVANLGKYAKFLLWSIIMNIAYAPLIRHNGPNNGNASSTALATIQKLLVAFIICMAVLMAEKLVIQLIALAFHRDAYADRLKEQADAEDVLTILYRYSRHVAGTDISDGASTNTKATQAPKVAVRRALRGLKAAAQSTTTALGNVASEMAGSSVMQTNSPRNRVKAALTSANKSKKLARRIFESFRKPGQDLRVEDIQQYYGYDEAGLEKAKAAFTFFDRDGNGDATNEEMDAALLELHRERMALEASIRDLDGAVRRLDEILVMVVFVIDVLIIISMATGDTKFSGWISSSATFVLSLSWMIGTTTQEILAACIFVFVKHPYDVGDRVDIDSNSYTVAKVELLSTSFKRTDGKFVWIAHNILTTKVIENVRRSGATSEKFVFDVAFDTTFEQLQALRDRMLKFCKENSRDFLPAFDVTVADMPEQGKMTLNADIKYRSNWQLGALKIRRRNMWICQLKLSLAELQIWGPAGAGNPDPAPADPTRYTVVPWDEVRATSAPHDHRASPPPPFEAAMAANALHSRHDSTTDLFDDIVGSGANTTGFNTPVMLGRSLPPLEGLAYPSQIAPQRPGVQQQGYPQQGFNPQIYNQGYGGRL